MENFIFRSEDLVHSSRAAVCREGGVQMVEDSRDGDRLGVDV